MLGAVVATVLAPVALTLVTLGSGRALISMAQWSAGAGGNGMILLILLSCAAVYRGYRIQKRIHKMEAERLRLDAAVRESEFRALRYQVNRHFLFNSLNALLSLINENDTRLRVAITELAELFRSSLQATDEHLITLRKELAFVEAFLAVQKLLHEDRLQTQMLVNCHALDEYVPPFALQALVENAVKYGIDSNPKGGLIVCTAEVLADTMVLQVRSPDSVSGHATSTGIGLMNVRRRLHLIFGAAATLRISKSHSNEVIAEIVLPRKVKDHDSLAELADF
jgi:two-component system, LytTR family, sensor kinase